MSSQCAQCQCLSYLRRHKAKATQLSCHHLSHLDVNDDWRPPMATKQVWPMSPAGHSVQDSFKAP